MNFLNIAAPLLIIIPFAFVAGHFWAKSQQLEEQIYELRLDYRREIMRDSEIDVPLIGGPADGGKMKISPLTREFVMPVMKSSIVSRPLLTEESWDYFGREPFAQATYLRHVEYRYFDPPKGESIGD